MATPDTTELTASTDSTHRRVPPDRAVPDLRCTASQTTQQLFRSAHSGTNHNMNIFDNYKLPPELRPFVDGGLLELVAEDEAKKTVEFHMPRLRRSDGEGRVTTYSLTWIHPDYNAQFCHYYTETPGDSPNFYVTEDTTDVGDELLDIGSIDELVEWLKAQTEHV